MFMLKVRDHKPHTAIQNINKRKKTSGKGKTAKD